MDTQAINKARIVYYGFFSSLFAFDFSEEKFNHLCSSLDMLASHPFDKQSGVALKNMKRRVETRGYQPLKNEIDKVFYNPMAVTVPMTASYIQEQRDDGAKRVEMIDYVNATPYRRNSEQFTEHEDHIEFIFGFLQRLIIEELEGDTAAGELFRTVFANVLNPMIDEFGEKLSCHTHSSFCRQAALVLESFMELERLYLDIPRPGANPKARYVVRNPEKQQPRTQAGCLRMHYQECS